MNILLLIVINIDISRDKNDISRDKNEDVIGSIQRGDISEVIEERHYWPKLSIPNPRGSAFLLVSHSIKTSMIMLLI